MKLAFLATRHGKTREVSAVRQRLGFLLLVILGLAFSTVQPSPAATRPSTPDEPMKDIRFVIVHTPGPNWDPGKSLFDQVGVQEHVNHYRKLQAAGKLALGGPFLDEAGGGMMIPEPGVTKEELDEFAQADPAVRSGLLKAQVRPWLIGMKKLAP